MTAPVRLEIHDLHTYYGASHVLQGASLEAAPGEVVALLGRNGMGKTTLVHTVAGFLKPRAGTVRIDGRRVDGLPAERVAAAGLALVPQGRRVFGSLSVGENLRVAARGGGPEGWTVEKVCDRFPILANRRRLPAGVLSGGEQQMLAIGRALVRNADVVLMDEPAEGLDPDRVRSVTEVIGELRAQGTTVLLVEQKVEFALSVADSVQVLERGRITFRTDPAAVRAEPAPLYGQLGFR